MPRIRVAALILLENRIVVVRHRFRSSVYHLLPGGGVEYGETLESALVREVREETGLACSIGRPLIINDTIAPEGDRHIVNITFEALITGGALTDSPDDHRVEAVETVAPGDLSAMDLRPPLAAAIHQFVRDPDKWICSYEGSIFTDGG